MEQTTGWISIDERFPPLHVQGENGDPDMVIDFTDDVSVLCSDGSVHTSYHDGDVWCDPRISGCPQWDVTHWSPLELK